MCGRKGTYPPQYVSWGVGTSYLSKSDVITAPDETSHQWFQDIFHPHMTRAASGCQNAVSFEWCRHQWMPQVPIQWTDWWIALNVLPTRWDKNPFVNSRNPLVHTNKETLTLGTWKPAVPWANLEWHRMGSTWPAVPGTRGKHDQWSGLHCVLGTIDG
jgi:hypothetical protein